MSVRVVQNGRPRYVQASDPKSRRSTTVVSSRSIAAKASKARASTAVVRKSPQPWLREAAERRFRLAPEPDRAERDNQISDVGYLLMVTPCRRISPSGTWTNPFTSLRMPTMFLGTHK